MARSLPIPCLQHGCPSLVFAAGTSYCIVHDEAYQRKINQRQTARRGKRPQYDSEWRTLSKRIVTEYIAANGNICPGDEEHSPHECDDANPLTADHVISFAHGGNSSEQNIRVICKRANSSKGGKTRRHIS